MRACNVLLSLGLLAGAAPISAQVDSSPARSDTAAARVLEHTFTTPSREFVRVRLEGGETYLARLTGGRIQLEVYPRDLSVQGPDLRELGAEDDHAVSYEIRPRVTAEYEIRVLVAVDQAVRLTMDRKSVHP